MAQRILHMTGTLGYKGLEASVINLYRNIDRSKFQFDFVVSSMVRELYDDEVEHMGGRIWRLPSRAYSPVRYSINLFFLFLRERYNTFHVHANSAGLIVDVLVAKIAGVKNIIVHSHNTSCIRLTQHRIFKNLLPLLQAYRIACSTEAAKWMFGSINNCLILPNGIDPEKYRFNIHNRMLIRSSLELSSESVVLGHVGSFNGAKNQEFVVDVFKVLLSKGVKAELIFVGEGVAKQSIIEYSKNNDVYKYIKFLGARSDVHLLLSAFDFFVFPSIFEGMPLSPIEAQFSGLKCYISTNVPNVTCIKDYVKYLPINKGATFWAQEIMSDLSYQRKDLHDIAVGSCFDIKTTTVLLQKFYESKLHV